MDSSTFKPYKYDPYLFIDFDTAITNLLSTFSLTGTDVTLLSSSEFVNYIKEEPELNLYTQKTGVGNYIGNQLVYLSAGSTTSQYVTGVLTTPSNIPGNLLNRYYPTVNMVPEIARKTREQIGGLFLPHNIAPLTYASFNPSPRFITDNIVPETIYILPDPSLYGSGYGNYRHGHNLPIDHIENVAWLKASVTTPGMIGRIVRCNNLPTFYGYTSKEHTLHSPPQGVNKFSDNFDFWANSVSGDIWANEDIYKLEEANKFNLSTRQNDLLIDTCDVMYRWRSDIYGNEFILLKAGATKPKLTPGGSDTDGDGIDDKPEAGAGLPDYGNYDGSSAGTGDEPFPESINPNGPEPGTVVPGENTGVQQESDTVYNNVYGYQLPLTACPYMLWGGNTLSPTSTATALDVADPTTVTGGVTSIVDGGWRPLRTGYLTYTPPATGWPIDDSVAEDQSENQFQIISAGSGYAASACNGFIDVDMQTAQGGPTLTAVQWLPDWGNIGSIDRQTPQVLNAPDVSSGVGYTVIFDDLVDGNGPPVYFLSSGLYPWTTDKEWHVADGGKKLHNGSGLQEVRDTFFETNCDRAASILQAYGSVAPDHGVNNIWACKIWDITNNPGFIQDPDQREIAAVRGPLNANYFYNPIYPDRPTTLKPGTTDIKQRGRKTQFFGTLDMLKRFQPGKTEEVLNIYYDYLQEEEFARIRCAVIDGTGNLDGGEVMVRSGNFIDTDTAPIDGSDAGIRGSADVWYYTSGGNGGYDGTDYTQSSAFATYIDGNYNVKPEDSSVVVRDSFTNLGTRDFKGAQFPQVPHTNGSRNYNLSVDEYNNMTCANVAELRQWSTSDVCISYSDDDNQKPDEQYRDISTSHPVTSFHSLTGIDSKRGYFPPPVGHLRRTNTFPVNTHPDAIVGDDEPIPSNILPTTAGAVTGFYVHDVWDGGSSFHLGPCVEEGVLDLPTTGEPELPGNPSIITDLCPTPGETWSEDHGRCVTDDGSGGQPTVGSTDPVVVDLTCGEYNGYSSGNNLEIPNIGSVPFANVSQMRKYASDSAADNCNTVTTTPTLWQQKHRAVHTSENTVNNIYYRNLYSDKIGTISEILPGLFAKYTQFVNTTDISILRDDKPFIDIDIIYDTIILRQEPVANRQTYVFDKLHFNYTTGLLTTGDIETFYIQTDSSNLSQHLCHYFNEDRNIILVGVTKSVNSVHIYPEIYKLDLVDHAWTKVFPKNQDDIDQFDSTIYHEGSACNVIDIDPGEISYNPQTDNYSVTYFGRVSVTGQTDYNQSPVIFNHILTERADKFELISANVYHSENKSNTTVGSVPVVNTGTVVLSSRDFTTTDTVSTNAREFELTVDLEGIDSDNNSSPLPDLQHMRKLEITWGDGDKDVIYRNIANSIEQYVIPHSTSVRISENTVIERTPHPQNDNSLSQYIVTHTYTNSGGNYTATLSGEASNFSSYSKTIQLSCIPYSVNSAVDGVKLLSTKLYTPTTGAVTGDYLLLTLETQSPRYITHNVINTSI